MALPILLSLMQAGDWTKNDSKALHNTTDGKLTLLKVFKDGCQYCDYMELHVFSDSKVLSTLKKNFFLYEVNSQNEKMPFDLDGKFTPSFYILDKKGTVIKHLLGAWTKSDFMDIIKPYLKVNR